MSQLGLFFAFLLTYLQLVIEFFIPRKREIQEGKEVYDTLKVSYTLMSSLTKLYKLSKAFIKKIPTNLTVVGINQTQIVLKFEE